MHIFKISQLTAALIKVHDALFEMISTFHQQAPSILNGSPTGEGLRRAGDVTSCDFQLCLGPEVQCPNQMRLLLRNINLAEVFRTDNFHFCVGLCLISTFNRKYQHSFQFKWRVTHLPSGPCQHSSWEKVRLEVWKEGNEESGRKRDKNCNFQKGVLMCDQLVSKDGMKGSLK